MYVVCKLESLYESAGGGMADHSTRDPEQNCGVDGYLAKHWVESIDLSFQWQEWGDGPFDSNSL